MKSWSVSQQVVAMSYCETKYYGMVRGASIARGLVGMLRDFGIELNTVLSADSGAAKGISSRRSPSQI